MCDEPLAITPGDPAGIGPEITLRALRELSGREGGAPACILFGAAKSLAKVSQEQDLGARIRSGTTPAVWPDVAVASPWEPEMPVPLGSVTEAGGRVAYAAVEAAVTEAMAGRVGAIVTGPISKEALSRAGYPFAGHTELLGKLAGGCETCMMLAHQNMRVAHVSTHIPLSDVPQVLTPKRLTKVLNLTLEALGLFGIVAPRIAVAALNPHAGEGGMFGREDIDICLPVIKRFRGEGHDVSGPISGDTVFVRALSGEFDAVIAMYHDQGHIPIKLLGFRVDQESRRWLGLSGVNITLGLPFIRTSVDHGTALDIAGKGIASAQSMVEAIELAEQLLRKGVRGAADTARVQA